MHCIVDGLCDNLLLVLCIGFPVSGRAVFGSDFTRKNVSEIRRSFSEMHKRKGPHLYICLPAPRICCECAAHRRERQEGCPVVFQHGSDRRPEHR